ncbi:MAG TPA: hypothetical protein VL381_01300, partial [Rhodocyclaceae bacterium]|nr:hypothetical protein [Rhodocyclaceae bacterium]
TIPKLAVEAGMEWGIRYAPSVMQRIANIPQQTKRTFPMVGLIYPYNVTYSLTIDWPQSVSMAADPSTRRYSNDFYTLETHNSFRGNQSKFDMSFETRDTYVAPKQVSKYIEDIRMTDRYIGNYITVSKDAIKSNGVLGKATLQETISQRLKKRVEQLSKSIDSGRLSGNDLAEAYCERAETQADLGNTSASIKDAAEASKLAPDSISVTECRASVSFFNGDLGKAITDYSKAIRNGSAGFANYYGRGRARFYDNKLSDAADDFLKAGRLTDEGGDKLYADLWYIWTMQRLGKPLAEEVRKRAEENPRGAWPRPALAMLIGKITPEQMLEEVNKKTGDERELNLTEAKFYLGQYYLNQGKAAAARTAFEEVRKQGITMYVEHVAAGLELARMKLK